jgi:hemerythrin-like domain-containing protein
MSALLSLTDEHQMISGLLAALQTYATRLRSGASVDPADLGRFSEVFRELVDYRHHEKEEGILMPLLARNGFAWSSGLLAELRGEHSQLRYLIDVLCQAAAKDAAVGSREEHRQIAEAVGAFVELERAHMRKEESLLMPEIAQRLDARALEQLSAELAQFDEVTGRNAGGAHIFRQAAELVQRYSEDSTTVDVTGVCWTDADARVAEVAPQDAALRALREAAGDRFTSYGRSS